VSAGLGRSGTRPRYQSSHTRRARPCVRPASWLVATPHSSICRARARARRSGPGPTRSGTTYVSRLLGWRERKKKTPTETTVPSDGACPRTAASGDWQSAPIRRGGGSGTAATAGRAIRQRCAGQSTRGEERQMTPQGWPSRGIVRPGDLWQSTYPLACVCKCPHAKSSNTLAIVRSSRGRQCTLSHPAFSHSIPFHAMSSPSPGGWMDGWMDGYSPALPGKAMSTRVISTRESPARAPF